MFAAIVLFVVAGLHVVYAVSEFADRLWELEATNGLAANDLWVWGIIDSVLAVALAVAGVSVLYGGAFGAIFGVAWAAVDAMRWLYWVPAHPLLSVVAIAINGVVIYALTVRYDWSAYR